VEVDFLVPGLILNTPSKREDTTALYHHPVLVEKSMSDLNLQYDGRADGSPYDLEVHIGS
jgi:hypothetical protein